MVRYGNPVFWKRTIISLRAPSFKRIVILSRVDGPETKAREIDRREAAMSVFEL